jgi:tetratricopeptide repeat protein
LAIAAQPLLPARDGRVALVLAVEISGPALAAGGADGPLGIELSGYALGSANAVLDYFADGLRLDLPADGAALLAGGVRYRGALAVTPGKVSIRVMARNRRNGAFGVRRLEIDVPPSLAKGTLPFAPQWPPDANAWVIFDSEHAGDAPLAAALPVIAKGQASRFTIASPGGAGLTSWQAHVSEEGGGAARDVPLIEVERHAAGGLETVVLEMPGHALPLGAYKVSVRAKAADGRDTASPEARFVSPGDRDVALWTGLTVVRAERFTALPKPAGAPLAAKQELEEYRRALGILAGGDQQSALGAVAAFELRVLTNRKVFAALREIEHQVLSELDTRDPEALMPAALLHQELTNRYLREGRPGFPRHALETALWIAEAYGKHGGPAAERAAEVIVSLAGTAIDSGAPKRASELFARASAVDPANEIARLGRAAVETRLGNLQAARDALSALLDRQADHREARLRIALLQSRSIDWGSAEKPLRALVRAGEPPDWVTALAYQELGRLLTRDRRAGAALELLAEGAARMPDDPGLAIEYAYACRRSGDAGRAQAVIARLAERPPSLQESARRRYSRWPDEALRSTRRSFQENALLRLPQLGAALGANPRAAG